MSKPQHRTIHDTTKIYPDFVKVIRFNVSFDVQLGAKQKTTKKFKFKPQFLVNREEDRANRHAKTTIYDIVMCNQFTHFVTLTFDKKKVKSRYDLSLLQTIAHRWFESQRK